MKLIYPRLPDGYAELEYLESTGTQYIDTGMKGNQDTSVELKIQKTGTGETERIGIFGSRQSASIDTIFVGFSTALGFFTDFGNNDTRLTAPASANPLVITNSKSGRSIGDETSSIGYSGTFETPTNLLLFHAINYGGGTLFDYFVGRVEYCKIWQSGTLVRNMIPAQRNADSVLGMYDLVNDVFYTNAGTGVFTAGPKVHYVKGVAYKPGINIWDEVPDLGYVYRGADGVKIPTANAFCNLNKIYVSGKKDIYVKTNGINIGVLFYSEDEYLGNTITPGDVITTPEDCVYINFNATGATYNHNITINLSDPAINGHYYPYAKAIKRLATAGRTFWQKLPSAYRPVKYLESTGTQYIDTGVKPTAQTKVFARLRLNSSDNNVGLFGAWQAETNSRWNLWTFTGYPNTTTLGYGEKNGSGMYLPFAVGQTLDVACYVEDGEVYWRTGEEEAHYPAGAFVEPNLNMYLFTRNRNGEAQNPAKLRCEKFTVYQGTSLVRLMLPVVRVSDSKPGMYDVVNDVFYTNSGTGEFIAGNE